MAEASNIIMKDLSFLSGNPAVVEEDSGNNDLFVFPHNRQITLSIIRVIVSLLSLVGSSCIIGHILFVQPKTSRYHRVLLGVSIFNWINTAQLATSSFLMPSDAPGVWEPHGNQTTCVVQGFMAQFGR